jgi:hypothetical protein
MKSSIRITQSQTNKMTLAIAEKAINKSWCILPMLKDLIDRFRQSRPFNLTMSDPFNNSFYNDRVYLLGAVPDLRRWSLKGFSEQVASKSKVGTGNS